MEGPGEVRSATKVDELSEGNCSKRAGDCTAKAKLSEVKVIEMQFVDDAVYTITTHLCNVIS